MLNVNDRDVVIPGQLIGEDLTCSSNCYYENSKLYSLVKGLSRVDDKNVNIIPAKGGYTPNAGDTVIGIVTDENVAGWLVDIHTAYSCFLRKDEVNDSHSRGGRNNSHRNNRRDRSFEREVSFNIGDMISTKILYVDEVCNANLCRPWKLSEGLVVTVNPKRVPRIIGRKQSMLNMIKEKTECKIVVGQNGLIWIKGAKTMDVVEAVKKIEKEAQTPGLTDMVGKMLDEKNKSHSRVDKNE